MASSWAKSRSGDEVLRVGLCTAEFVECLLSPVGGDQDSRQFGRSPQPNRDGSGFGQGSGQARVALGTGRPADGSRWPGRGRLARSASRPLAAGQGGVELLDGTGQSSDAVGAVAGVTESLIAEGARKLKAYVVLQRE